ncbi:MAG: hypothetical protein U0325_06325 [Polyangiales bacterium]
MNHVRLCGTDDIPPADAIAQALRAAWPGVRLDTTRSWYGPRVRAEVILDGVAVTLDLHHAQGRRRPLAVTTVRASCATRGLALRVLAARSIPSSWSPMRLPRPSLQALGAIVAPAAIAPVLLDDTALDALAAVGANPASYPTLDVERDAVELSLYGWPGDVASATHLAALVARITRAVAPAIAAVGGAPETHPEVHALAAWEARRRRIALTVVLAVVGMMLVTTTLTAIAMIPTR